VFLKLAHRKYDDAGSIFSSMTLSLLIPAFLTVSLLVAHLARQSASAPDPLPTTYDLMIFATGETLSYLDPCGCRAKQRGGIPRRDSVGQRLSETCDNVLLVDNGDLVEKSTRLDLVKADTLIEAMNGWRGGTPTVRTKVAMPSQK